MPVILHASGLVAMRWAFAHRWIVHTLTITIATLIQTSSHSFTICGAHSLVATTNTHFAYAKSYSELADTQTQTRSHANPHNHMKALALPSTFGTPIRSRRTVSRLFTFSVHRMRPIQKQRARKNVNLWRRCLPLHGHRCGNSNRPSELRCLRCCAFWKTATDNMPDSQWNAIWREFLDERRGDWWFIGDSISIPQISIRMSIKAFRFFRLCAFRMSSATPLLKCQRNEASSAPKMKDQPSALTKCTRTIILFVCFVAFSSSSRWFRCQFLFAHFRITAPSNE